MKSNANASLTLDSYRKLSFPLDIDMCLRNVSDADWNFYLDHLDFHAIRPNDVYQVWTNLKFGYAHGFAPIILDWFNRNNRHMCCPLRALVMNTELSNLEVDKSFIGRSLSWLYALERGVTVKSIALLELHHAWHSQDVVFWQQHVSKNAQAQIILEHTFFDCSSLHEMYKAYAPVYSKVYMTLAIKSLIAEPFLLTAWSSFFAEIVHDFPLFDLNDSVERSRLSHVLQWKIAILDEPNALKEVDFDF